MREKRSDFQCPGRPFVQPAGRAETPVALETGQRGTRAPAEVSIDRSPIVTELPQALLSSRLRAHRPSAVVVTIIAIVRTVIVVFLMTRWLWTAGPEEKVQGRCPGDACRADKKDAQCDGRYVFHNNDKTNVGRILFNHC